MFIILLQNGALWDIYQIHCGICGMCLLSLGFIVDYCLVAMRIVAKPLSNLVMICPTYICHEELRVNSCYVRPCDMTSHKPAPVKHYSGVIMDTMASQIISFTIVYSSVYSGADQSKHQSSVSLAFVRGIHRWPVNSQQKWPVTRKMFPFDDVIMIIQCIFPGTSRRLSC